MLIPGIDGGVNKSDVLLSAGKMACGLPQPACEKPKSAPVGRVKVGVAEPLGDALTLMMGALNRDLKGRICWHLAARRVEQGEGDFPLFM